MESYEKKYKNALEWARQVMNGKTGFIRKEVEEVFPELAESEDEKIRKELIEHIKANKWADYVLFQKFSPDDVIAWLEKQESVEEIVARCKDSWYNEGKIAGMAEGLTDDEKYQQGWHDALEKQGEKPQGKTALEGANEEKADNANKVEPKFKVGDWITDGYLHCKISDVLDDRYIVDTKFTKRSAIPFKRENEYHLWTIEDAKDGDVLASNVLISKYNKPFIYNGNHNSTHVGAYCGISTENRFNVATEKCRWTANVNIRPASKEQRDLLFQKMRESGYEWDAEKKELKLLITNGGDFEQENCEQSSAWSEEDKNFMYDTLSNLTELKDRYGDGYGNVGKCIEWLKSLRPQKQWKPSEEQMDALEHFVRSIGESGFVSPYDVNLKLVHSLLNDLKKLKS